MVSSSGMSLGIRSDPPASDNTDSFIPPVAAESYVTRLQAFTAHLRDGNPRTALAAAGEACQAAPNRPEPHYAGPGVGGAGAARPSGAGVCGSAADRAGLGRFVDQFRAMPLPSGRHR